MGAPAAAARGEVLDLAGLRCLPTVFEGDGGSGAGGPPPALLLLTPAVTGAGGLEESARLRTFPVPRGGGGCGTGGPPKVH